MQDLTNAIEEATKLVLDAELPGISVFLGQSDETQVRPCVRVYAQQGEERPNGSGNFLVTLTVTILSNSADVDVATHRSRVRLILGVMMEDDITDQLSAAVSDFHAFNPPINRRAREDKEDESWLSELSMDIYCCLTAIA